MSEPKTVPDFIAIAPKQKKPHDQPHGANRMRSSDFAQLPTALGVNFGVRHRCL